MPRVTIWREEVLPGSETFIVNQMQAMRRWTPLLSGIRALPNPLGITRAFALEGSAALPHQLDRWLYWRTGTSPRLHRRLSGSGVVHAHFGPDGARIARAARLARRPLAVTFHGYDATVPAAQLGVDYTRLFASAAALVAVSQFIRGCLIEAGAPAQKVRVLPIGIPLPPDVAAGPREARVLFVGRLVEKKGVADLLQALAGLSPPPPVHIIGDGPLRSELEALAARLRVPARFLGAREPAQVAAAMRTSALLCAPSKTAANGDREGLPIALLEAAAHRLPVVSYGAGGILEAVVDGETGVLAPEGDVAGLARGVQAVLGDPALAERLGAAGRRRVEQAFDITACTARLEELYDELARA